MVAYWLVWMPGGCHSGGCLLHEGQEEEEYPDEDPCEQSPAEGSPCRKQLSHSTLRLFAQQNRTQVASPCADHAEEVGIGRLGTRHGWGSVQMVLGALRNRSNYFLGLENRKIICLRA
jgi:hypothetical protein